MPNFCNAPLFDRDAMNRPMGDVGGRHVYHADKVEQMRIDEMLALL
jgi:hypothetical protein